MSTHLTNWDLNSDVSPSRPSSNETIEQVLKIFSGYLDSMALSTDKGQ